MVTDDDWWLKLMTDADIDDTADEQMLWPLSVTPGVTHVRPYHHPSDAHFWQIGKGDIMFYFLTAYLIKVGQ